MNIDFIPSPSTQPTSVASDDGHRVLVCRRCGECLFRTPEVQSTKRSEFTAVYWIGVRSGESVCIMPKRHLPLYTSDGLISRHTPHHEPIWADQKELRSFSDTPTP